MEIDSDSDDNEAERTEVVKRPTRAEIHDDVWSLIQHCCAEDPKSRPAMDEIIKEMESWCFF